ncbi:45 kda calcium-binding protein [Plakobranchus ocellatus]|uniref:45 kDa calcium-binding protein n=1 Tax=Plakobranchus ocellatus TaxID=259542 RepID=A0AAV3ZLR2_9GAST|nr:45 kda calcium-binding protein [Plakobranchus ocellatus]
MCLTWVLCGPIRRAPAKNDQGHGNEANGQLRDALPNDGNASRENEAAQVMQQQPPIIDKNLMEQSAIKPDRKGVDHNFEKAIKHNGGKKLDAKQLEPADHLDVVKMEHDGHVNQEYHKEMFLGEEHEEFKSHPVDRAEERLKEIVAKADLDKDGSLSQQEMQEWVAQKMKEHFDEARMENEHIFKHLDPDGDGFIKWKEYYVHFLLSRGFGVDDALQHVQDYDETITLKQEDKDALISYKFRWTDADTSPTDNQLSKGEFMVFRHPEHSKQSLESMVNNVMRGLGKKSKLPVYFDTRHLEVERAV